MCMGVSWKMGGTPNLHPKCLDIFRFGKTPMGLLGYQPTILGSPQLHREGHARQHQALRGWLGWFGLEWLERSWQFENL